MKNKLRKGIAVLAAAALVLAGTSAFAAGAAGEPQTPSGDEKMTTSVSVVSREIRILGQTEDFVMDEGESQELKVIVDAAEPVSFQWSVNGADIPGAVNSAYMIENAVKGDYVYSLKITDGYGQTKTTEIRVRVSDVYSYRTLTDQDITVSGYIHKNARLIVTPLDEAHEAYSRMRGQMKEGCEPYSFNDVSLVLDDGEKAPFFGTLEVAFPVDGQYEGQELRVFHLHGGEMKIYSETVREKRLCVNAEGLSPFMIEAAPASSVPAPGAGKDNPPPGAGKDDPAPGRGTSAGPKTGDDTDITFPLILLAVAAAALAIGIFKKRAEHTG